jgi:hypothetical protein
LSGAYTGEVSFSSRANGAFGDHTYSIGIGKLNRDGAAWVIDWTNASAAVNEIFDAVNATFVPAFPVTSNCNSDNACWWGSSAPGGDSDAADISYFFVVNTVPIAVGINSESEGGLVGWIELDLPNAIPSGGDGGSDANSGD